MTDEIKEPNKPSIEDIVDRVMTPPQTTQGEQPQESSPAPEQLQDQPEGGSDPLKTQSKEEPADTGFATHPKWIQRENKLKEAREQLKERDAKLERLTKLLDDPDVYAKHLKAEGFSARQIEQALRERGQQPRVQEVEQSKRAQEQSIAQKACKKLGWDISRLDQDQQAYIDDHVNLTMAVLEEQIGSMLDKRLGPLEQVTQEWNQQKLFSQEEQEVQRLAKDEFPNTDWKAIQQAINNYCLQLDEKDPRGTLKFSYEDLYYRATRPLLKEMETQKVRQDARNAVKANARPLGTAPTTDAIAPSGKKMKTHEFLEAKLDSMGIR